MRTQIAAAAVLILVVVAVLAVPSRSQEPTRVGAVIDISALTKQLDALATSLDDIKKQNEEMKKAALKGNETLDIIAAGVGVLRVPIRWEYKFVRSRSEKLANELGAQGWEFVSTYDTDWFVYRRPLPPKLAEEAGGAAQ